MLYFTMEQDSFSDDSPDIDFQLLSLDDEVRLS